MPTSTDEKYRELSLASHKHLQTGQYSSYRNDLYEMSKVLLEEKNHRDRLDQLAIIFYLDLSGVWSLGDLKRRFDSGKRPRLPLIYPDISEAIISAYEACGLSPEELIELFKKLVDDNMLPAHLFTVDETAELLQILVTKGRNAAIAAIPKRSSFKVNHL